MTMMSPSRMSPIGPPIAASGYLWKYAQTVGSAKDGAVTHPGGGVEKHTYADI